MNVTALENSTLGQRRETNKADGSVEKEQFLTMDLASSESVQKMFPLLTGHGTGKRVPTHIRCPSKNPWEAIISIEGFRRMSDAQQKTEVTNWNNYSRNQKKVFQENGEELWQIQKDLILRRVFWEDVAPHPFLSGSYKPTVVPLRHSQRTQSARNDAGPSTKKQKTREPIPDHVKVFNDQQAAVLASVNNENVQNQRPLATAASKKRKVVTPKEACLGSSLVDRQAVANAARQRARSDTKRKLGEPGTKLHHQVDSVSNTAVLSAHEAACRSSDTIHLATRQSGQPRRSVMYIEINEMDELPSYGGRPSDANVKQRPKKLVTVSGPRDVHDLAYMVKELTIGLKHPGRTNEMSYMMEDKATGTTASTFADFKAIRTGIRRQPIVTPCDIDVSVPAGLGRNQSNEI